jgi:hypothetical protein
MSHPSYSRANLELDLRRLNDAALDLLWRLNPEALVLLPTPQWLPEVLPTEVHRAASELMNKLFLILDEVNEVDTPGLVNNWSMLRGKIRNTNYPLRYAAEDLLDLTAAFTRLSRRLRAPDHRKIGDSTPNRRLRWLAENLIAHADPVVRAAIVLADRARIEAMSISRRREKVAA